MKKVIVGSVLTALALLAGSSYGQIYNGTPDWISTDTPISTGGTFVDLDQDGWLDFVVANGNDIYRQRLVVYYGNGDGTLPLTPDWQSDDDEYNGHLAIADVDGDGWLDVAVGLTMADAGTATARVYLNNEGTLSTLPDWESHDELAGFQVSFGDVNGDGRPDLAVGTSWPYSNPHPWHNYVYMNIDGALEATPSWVSDDTWDIGDVLFCDVNRDGWLDLVAVGEGTDTWVYLNSAGTLATTATWHTTDSPTQFSVMGTYGDVDADGWMDLFTTDNTQLAGDGYFRRYDGLIGGLFTTTPTWSYYEGYGSAIALADVDADGDLDLATGGWWENTRLFMNSGGLYPGSPDYSSTGTSVVETICFGDVDRDGLRRPIESFDVTATPGQHLFHLAHQPVERIEYVTVDGAPLGPDEYTFDLLHGWLSVGPAPTAAVEVRYVYSLKPDMGVTNWDDSRGNYLYYNYSGVIGFGDFEGDQDVDVDDYDEFVGCFTGPGGGPLVPDCVPGDFDWDDDVDCDDWAEFAAAWTAGGSPPSFAECPLDAPLPAPYPHSVPKNRYISFDPNVGGTAALRVELTGSELFPGSTGVVGWVGLPDLHEISRVEDTPVFSAAWPALVHVGDCMIVPASTYEVRSSPDGISFGGPLELVTAASPTPKLWADIVGNFDGAEWTAPNGTLNMDDIMAFVQKFQGNPTAPPLTRVDVDPDRPNEVAGMTDLQQIVIAFKGGPYPFSDPVDCP